MSLKKKRIINKREDFIRLKKDCTTYRNKFISIAILENTEKKNSQNPTIQPSKFAFITPKYLGKAHQRNKLKRRLKEIISKHIDKISENHLILIIPKSKTSLKNFNFLEKNTIQILKKANLIHE